MSIWIEKDEATAARRRVPCRIFTSNGTTPDTGALGDAIIMGTNSLATFSVNSTLRGVNANQGMYCIELTQSEVSVLGTHPLYHTVGDFPHHIATIQVVNHNHFSTLSAISDVTLAAKEYSNVTLRIGLVDYSGASVGARDIAPRVYSGVSIEVKSGGIQTSSVGAGNYSGMSVEIKSGGIQTSSFGAGTYSNVTFQGVTRVNSGVTLNADTHSGATIQGVTRVNSGVTLNADIHSGATVEINNIAAGVYSGVSIEVKSGGIQAASLGAGTITAAKFAASAIDAAALATDAGQEIADRVIMRGLQGGNDSDRSVGQALAVLRNRVEIDGSTVTVYQVDDSTSLWTGSITTGVFPIQGINPVGP